MDRRLFIKNTISVSVLSSLMLEGGLSGCMLHSNEHEGRALVLVQLEGGNDGLNTVIPLDQYSNLISARKNLLIPAKKVLPLNNTSVTGFHPSLGQLQKLYNDKLVTIIQGVGFAHPDLSHFKAIDIWHTGCDGPNAVSTGWLGRFMEHQAQNGNAGTPAAIQIGATLSKVLQGTSASTGMVVRDTTSFYDLMPGITDHAADSRAGDNLSLIRTTVAESRDYLVHVKAAAKVQKNLSTMYPPEGINSLADQLKIVAQLVGGGLQTKVYIVNIKGFDTHDEQVESTDSTKGGHADLLAQVSVAIAAFEDDLHLMDKQDKVLGMVYSEFGRRIKSNASFGCDHGTAAPVILFGSRLKGGLVGSNPQIAGKVEVNDNLATQTDFRSVYASVLQGWFGAAKPRIDAALMGGYPILDLFKA